MWVGYDYEYQDQSGPSPPPESCYPVDSLTIALGGSLCMDSFTKLVDGPLLSFCSSSLPLFVPVIDPGEPKAGIYQARHR